jgi:hypothetical protein
MATLNSTSSNTWSSADKQTLLKNFKLLSIRLPGGRYAGAFHGVHVLQKGVWDWVRGMHIALYGEPVAAYWPHFVIPPVHAFDSTHNHPPQEQILYLDRLHELIRQVLECKLEQCDCIIAWGKQVRYHCAWTLSPRTQRWECLWELYDPLSAQWSSRVNGFARPWRGFYSLPSPPAAAFRM